MPGIVEKAASNRDYAPGFMTDLMAKDLGLAVNAARELRVPVVVAPAAQQVLRLASSHGYGRKDFSSVYAFLRPSGGESPSLARAILRRARAKGDAAVSLYIMLSTLSESGRRVLGERPGWIRKVNADVRRMGARVMAQCAILGPLRFRDRHRGPDNATISRVSVELGARWGRRHDHGRHSAR